MASFEFCRRTEAIIISHTSGVNHKWECEPMLAFRCSHVLYTETVKLLVAHTEHMVQSWNNSLAHASQLYEHMGYKTLYIFYTEFHFPLLFYFPGQNVASGRCHSLRSVNFLLPIKMQIHTCMQCMMDLGKPWSFLLTILYWFNFNLNCL